MRQPFQRGATADLMLTSIERRTSAAVAAAGAPLLAGDLGCDFESPSAMPSRRPVGRAGRFFAGGALGAALGCAFCAAGGCFCGATLGFATCFGVGAGVGRTTGSGSGGAGTGSGAAMSVISSSPSRAAGGVSLITGAVDCTAVSAIRSTSIGGLSNLRSPAVHWTESRAMIRTCAATAMAIPRPSFPLTARCSAIVLAYCPVSEPSVTAASAAGSALAPVVTSEIRVSPARLSSPITRITRP